jgi:hypothetical protein
MKISNLKSLGPKDLIVFDLDGTLVRTKALMDKEMSQLISKLLLLKKVAVIGGGKYALFQRLFLRRLQTPKSLLKNLFLFPTTSTSYYRYQNGWNKIYSIELTVAERAQIKKAFNEMFREIGYKHPKTYGKIIEDRGTQVTYSVYGQEIVKALGEKGIKMKEDWLKKNFKLKMKMTKIMQKKLPNLEVRAAGFTSIDVTKKGIDKAYGIRQIQKHLRIPIKKMLFVGDAIYPGGNDYAAVKTGIDYIKISGPEEAKRIIKKLIQK